MRCTACWAAFNFTDSVSAFNRFATGGLAADRTLYLQLPRAAGRARTARRGEELDRLEREDDAFYARIAEVYERLARAEPERVLTIDASEAPAMVLAAALAALEDLL